MRFLTCLLLAAGAALLPSSAATAAGAGAIALTFNTSTRAEGMGGAGVAGVWGGDTNVWANPALLAFRPGVRYGTQHGKLAAGLADDIVLDAQELTLGYAGCGLLWGRSPLTQVDLDLGIQQATDENGDPLGSFEAWEHGHAWGVGVGATQLLDRFAGTRLNRWFDLAGGLAWRDYEEQLAADPLLQDGAGGGRARASSRDWGWVARVTPLNTLVPPSGLAEAPVGLVVEASYGRAKQNTTDDAIAHVDAEQTDVMPTAYVSGWAVHAEVRPGRGLLAGATRPLREALGSLFAFTYAEQTIEPGYVWIGDDYIYAHDTSGRYDEESRGWELTFLNLLSVRRGHVTIDYGDIDGDTTGWGLNVQAGRLGGFRYDHATVPQATGLPDTERTGWHVWVDALAILGEN